MNIAISRKLSIVAVLGAITLSGCASGPGMHHRQHHADASAPHGRMAMGTGMGAGHMGRGMMMSDAEMQSMCGMHMSMVRGKTPEERRAMVAEHMKSMSPQLQQQHMEMMQMHLQMMQDYMKSQGAGK